MQRQQMIPDQSQQPSLGSHLDPSTPSTPPAPTTPPQLGRTLSGNKSKVSSGRRIKRYSTGEEGGAPSGVARTSSGAYDRGRVDQHLDHSCLFITCTHVHAHAHTHACTHAHTHTCTTPLIHRGASKVEAKRCGCRKLPRVSQGTEKAPSFRDHGTPRQQPHPYPWRFASFSHYYQPLQVAIILLLSPF